MFVSLYSTFRLAQSDPQTKTRGHLWDRRMLEDVPTTPELRKDLDAALQGPDGRRALELETLMESAFMYFWSFLIRFGFFFFFMFEKKI